MSTFIQSDDSISVYKSGVDVYWELPVGNYVVRENPLSGLYLSPAEPFNLPEKVYCDTRKHSQRICDTFNRKNNSTGVLLSGEKGSGKTLLAKYIAWSINLPTILVNECYSGDGFNSLISGIEQPCVIIFDEFEKIYSKEDQVKILTLLDGVFNSKKLFIFTVNNKFAVNDFFINRPGRIHYAIEYKGLSDEFIREYCEDNLINKEYIRPMIKDLSIIEELNFDMLQTIVWEMNTYGESHREALKLLNIRMDNLHNSYYNICLYQDNKAVDKKLYSQKLYINPFKSFTIDLEVDDEYEEILFTHEHIFVMQGNTIELNNGEYRAVLNRIIETYYNPLAF